MASLDFVITIPELAQLRTLLQQINERISHMATQQDIDALAAQVQDIASRISTAVADIRQDIADIKAANPAVDLTSLQANVDTLAGVADTAAELDAENPAPPAT